MAKASKVSRSVFQKICEENKRLKSDIYTLVMKPLTGDSILVRNRWKKKFEDDRLLATALHEYAVQYIKDNPDSIPAQIAREFPLKTSK